MIIFTPRLVALDSSHWANWIAAFDSHDGRQRDAARSFHGTLLTKGWVVFLSFHNISELLAIENESKTRRRIEFVRSLPLLAWFQTPGNQSSVGDITDIVAAEAIACCEGLEDPREIANRAKNHLIRFGNGIEALGEDDRVWQILRPLMIQRSERDRTITAIAPFRVHDEDTTLAQLLQGQLSSPTDVERKLAAIEAKIERQVKEKGDRRIKDPSIIAKIFVREVVDKAGRPDSVADLVVSQFIEAGLELHEIREHMTIGELSRLATFRRQLRIVAPKTDRSFQELRKSVRMERCPHWIITQDMRRHAPDLPERKGSDLVDGYLAVLAAYVDHLFVDKRTEETFRRLPKASQTLRIVKRVSKAGKFEQILDVLEK